MRLFGHAQEQNLAAVTYTKVLLGTIQPADMLEPQKGEDQDQDEKRRELLEWLGGHAHEEMDRRPQEMAPGHWRSVPRVAVLCQLDQQSDRNTLVLWDGRPLLQAPSQEQTMQTLLAALLRQLVEQCSQRPNSVLELHAACRASQSQPLPEEISSAVADVMDKFPEVYLVVDVLDECLEDTARDLFSSLSDLQRSTGMKLLATSRPTIDLGE
ncbi:hypothetical protein BJX99DRAFT_263656 [Aspergillus californicus]